MPGQQERDAMPRCRQPRWHTAYALVAYIAQNTDLRLCTASLAEAVRRRLPEAEVLGDGLVSIDGRLMDLFACAQIKRGDDDETRSAEPTMLREYEEALEGWTLPGCPACRGRAVGHTCGPDCQSPHKEWLVFRRDLLGLGPPSAWQPPWRWPPAVGEWGGSIRIIDRQWVPSSGLPPPWEAADRGLTAQ